MKLLVFSATALLAVSALAACATDPNRPPSADTQRANLYRAHAGEPINSFIGRVNDWTSLDETALVVWTGPKRGYLLEVLGPCIELPWAQRITFSRSSVSGVKVYDDVIVLGRQPQTMPCTIREIRPIDVEGFKRAEKAEREARQGAG
jgi:hypothetical protein